MRQTIIFGSAIAAVLTIAAVVASNGAFPTAPDGVSPQRAVSTRTHLPEQPEGVAPAPFNLRRLVGQTCEGTHDCLDPTIVAQAERNAKAKADLAAGIAKSKAYRDVTEILRETNGQTCTTMKMDNTWSQTTCN